MPENPLEVVQNLILDTIEPFVARLEAVEQHVNVVAQGVDALSVRGVGQPTAPQNDEVKVGTPEKPSDVSEGAREAILALHRLDAVPAQWTMKNGKREAAPDGLWEITCAECKDHNVLWMQGDPEPRRCKTVELLVR